MKKTLLIAVVAAGIAAAAWGVYRGMQPAPGGPLRISGNIELTEINIAFKMAGRLIERRIDEGDPVQRGQVVARLDNEQLLRQRDQMKATLEGARLMMAQSDTALEWQQQALAADQEMRRAEVGTAEAHLRELKSGARPQERQEAQAAVSAASSEFERSKKDWERAQVLRTDDDISQAQFDQFRTRYESAQAMLSQARERASLIADGARVETIEAAAAQLERARAGFKGSLANEIELKRRRQEIETRRADVARARAQVAFIESQLQDTVAVSPADGIGLVKSADVGEVLAPGTPVLTIGDIRHPWVRGYIPEASLGQVKIGQKARITTDSYPGKAYWGRVSFISSEAEFTPKQIQTSEERIKLVYRIKIDVDNPRQELKNNMPVDAELMAGN